MEDAKANTERAERVTLRLDDTHSPDFMRGFAAGYSYGRVDSARGFSFFICGLLVATALCAWVYKAEV